MTAALDIAGNLGWPVLPVWWLTETGHCACPKGETCDRSPGKHPIGHRGLTDATTDPATIRRWWGRHPEARIGVRCDRLLVVDVDHRPGQPSGWGQWLEVAEPHGWQITDTLVNTTPSGGVHVVYELADGMLDGSGVVDGIAPSVDTRYHDNYVIVPPSAGYEVLHDASTALAPAWLCLHITDRKKRPSGHLPAPDLPTGEGTRYGLQALDGECGRVALAPEGRRNKTLVQAAYRAGQLVAGGQLDAHTAADRLHAAALRCGLGTGEAVATIRSGLSGGLGNPRRPAA